MLAQRTLKDRTPQGNSTGRHAAGLREARQADGRYVEPQYLPGRSRDNRPPSARSGSELSWSLGEISIFPTKHPPRVGRDISRKAKSAFSKTGEPAEREADAFADWIASLPDRDWTRELGDTFSTKTLAYFGAHLGYDFSLVRVHTDKHAARTAHGIGARAFTLGSDVYFGQGQFNPASRDGRRLMAHELTHVAQQRAGRTGGATIQRDEDPGNDRGKRIAAYKQALKKPDWERAALMLNGFNADDIDRHIADLDEPKLRAIIAAADVVMKGWPRVVQEQCEKRLKKFELTDFDREWIKKIAMPILLYPDASISLDHRILMVAHARLESGAIPGGGKFKDPDAWNVFNLQMDAGTPNTKKVPRWEYKKKVPEDQVDKINFNETIAVESDGHTENWKKYKKELSGEVREFVKTWVGIPQYSDMNEAVKGYLEFLKKGHKTAFTALTTDDQGAAAFAGGITHFGTGYNRDIGKKIQGFVSEMTPKLRDYAKERRAELTKDTNAQRLPGEQAVLNQLDK